MKNQRQEIVKIGSQPNATAFFHVNHIFSLPWGVVSAFKVFLITLKIDRLKHGVAVVPTSFSHTATSDADDLIGFGFLFKWKCVAKMQNPRVPQTFTRVGPTRCSKGDLRSKNKTLLFLSLTLLSVMTLSFSKFVKRKNKNENTIPFKKFSCTHVFLHPFWQTILVAGGTEGVLWECFHLKVKNNTNER